MASGSWPMNRCSNASNPSIVSPDPMPVTPSSVSTRTMVAANERRGTGSQAAGNGRIERQDEPLQADSR